MVAERGRGGVAVKVGVVVQVEVYPLDLRGGAYAPMVHDDFFDCPRQDFDANRSRVAAGGCRYTRASGCRCMVTAGA